MNFKDYCENLLNEGWIETSTTESLKKYLETVKGIRKKTKLAIEAELRKRQGQSNKTPKSFEFTGKTKGVNTKREIKSRSGKVLYSAEVKNIKELLMSAIKSGVSLRNVDLSSVDLSGVDLSGVDLSGAGLYNAKLSGANLRNANLSGVWLQDANLSRANLRDAKLSGAYLSGAKLVSTNLQGVDLSGVDLSGVKRDKS